MRSRNRKFFFFFFFFNLEGDTYKDVTRMKKVAAVAPEGGNLQYL